MINQYETVFILTPVLSEEQMKETVTKFKEFLVEKGAEFIHEEYWGLLKLAYPIQKKTNGFYHLFEFKAEGEIIADYEVMLKRDERVMRFLTMKLDKHAVTYSAKRRRLRKEKKEAEAQPAKEGKKE